MLLVALGGSRRELRAHLTAIQTTSAYSERTNLIIYNTCTLTQAILELFGTFCAAVCFWLGSGLG